MALLTFRFGTEDKQLQEAALDLKVSLIEGGNKVLQLPAKHIATIQMMEDPAIKEYDAVIVEDGQLLNRVQTEFLLHVARSAGVPIYTFGKRCDESRNPFEGATYLLAWADELLAVQESVKEEHTEEELSIAPQLLAFIEAETNREKLEVFRQIKDSVDDDMINTIAVILDVEIAENDDLEVRCQDVIYCLETMVKYEVVR